MTAPTNLREVLARRSEIRSAMETASPEQFAAFEAEAATLNEAERRFAVMADIDRRAAASPINGTGDNRFDTLAAQVTLVDVINAQVPGLENTAGAGRAREVSAELARRSGKAPGGLLFSLAASGAPVEQRVLTTTLPGGGPGGNLVATVLSPNLIDRLRERILIRRLGATVLGGLTGNVSVPRLKASATAQWLAENTAITQSDPQFDSVSLAPRHCGALVEISRQLLQQSSIDVARLVEADMAKLLATALDAAAINGPGGVAPTGLLTAGSGITIIPGGTNGAAPVWSNVLNLPAAIDQANGLDGSLAFLTNARAIKAMRMSLKTSTDTASNFLMSDGSTLAGYPLGSSSNVPSNLTKGTATGLSALIFGDFSQLLIGFYSELDILVNPYVSPAYEKGGIQVRAMMTASIAVKQPLAFAAITDLIA